MGGSSPFGLAPVGSAGDSVDVGTTLPGTAFFSVTRNFDDSVALRSSINGQTAATGTITDADTDRHLTYTFQQLVIGLGSTKADFSVDSVNVSVIPNRRD